MFTGCCYYRIFPGDGVLGVKSLWSIGPPSASLTYTCAPLSDPLSMHSPMKPTSLSTPPESSSRPGQSLVQGGLRGTPASLLFFSYKFPHLKYCFTGGETLLPDTLENWRAQTGLDLREFYGQTETVPALGDHGLVDLVGSKGSLLIEI